METWRLIILVIIYFISGILAYGADFMCGAPLVPMEYYI